MDPQQLHYHFIKTKQLFHCAQLNQIQFQTSGTPPTNLLLMLEDSFKSLVRLHNEYKQIKQNQGVMLSYVEVYRILKLYLEVRSGSLDESRQKLREWVVELIDRSWLSSVEYRRIYHEELLLGEGGDRSSVFDPVVSENCLLRKELMEERSGRQQVEQQFSKEREVLEQAVRQCSRQQSDSDRLRQQLQQMERKYKDKVGQMERELVTMRIQLQTKEKQLIKKEYLVEKLQTRLSDMTINQNELLDITVESELQVVKDELQQSSIIHRSSKSITRRIVYDH